MASYPTLASGSVALYPLSQTTRLRSPVHRSLDDSEQRWMKAVPLLDFVLEYRDLSDADRQTIQTFFDSTKGGFDSTWDITLGSTTYSYCAFAVDELEPRETDKAETWNFTVRVKQVKKSGSPAGVYSASFPSLTGAITTQRPWGYDRRFLNSTVDMVTGKRHSFYHRSTPLMAWQVGGEGLPDADVTTLLEFFIGVEGRRRSFSFTDPETDTAYPSSRLDSEEFVVRNIGPNENSLYLNVVEHG